MMTYRWAEGNPASGPGWNSRVEFEAVVQFSTVANPRQRVDQKQALIGAGVGVACVVGAEQINRGVAAATARLSLIHI